MTWLAVACGVGAIMFIGGVLLRGMLPGCKQNMAGDFGAAFMMIMLFGIGMLIVAASGEAESVISTVFGNLFGEVATDIVPFYKCINHGYDVMTLARKDCAAFIEELIKILYLMVGINLLEKVIPLKQYNGLPFLQQLFLYFTFRFLLLIILAFVYIELTNIGIIEKIVMFLIPIVTACLSLPALANVVARRNNRALIFGIGLAIPLLLTQLQTILGVGLYMAMISYLATNRSAVTDSLYMGLSTVIAFAPAMIVVLGIVTVIKSTWGVGRH